VSVGLSSCGTLQTSVEDSCVDSNELSSPITGWLTELLVTTLEGICCLELFR
jgi:hypothetical protein